MPNVTRLHWAQQKCALVGCEFFLVLWFLLYDEQVVHCLLGGPRCTSSLEVSLEVLEGGTFQAIVET